MTYSIKISKSILTIVEVDFKLRKAGEFFNVKPNIIHLYINKQTKQKIYISKHFGINYKLTYEKI